MKTLLSSAVALALIATGPALAKPHDDDHGGGNNKHQNNSAGQGGGHQDRGKGNGGGHQNRGNGNGGGDHQNRGISSGNNPGHHRGWVNNPDNAAAQKYRGGDNDRNRSRANERLRNAGPRNGDNFRNDNQRRGDNYRNARRGNVNVNIRAGGGGGMHRWNNPNDRRYFESRWSKRARNFNTQAYRRAFVSPRRYRIGTYYRPSGWYYRRWGVGAYFPSLFWTSNYWLNDWYSYGLMSPPWGYEWVRYGNDAVLVDVRTGMILQVRYDVFW